jgi:thioredoxin reductase (NADPH)
VLDELLASWGTRSRPSFTGITVLGHQWSAETQAAKEFLARNQVPYRHLDVADPAAGRLLRPRARPDVALPVVLLPEGEVLQRPTLRELARGRVDDRGGQPVLRPGRRRRRTGGARRSGVRRQRGLRTLLVERAATGGQAGRAAASRTTSASPRACRAPSWRSGPATRRCASASRS